MLRRSLDILTQFPIRGSSDQKDAFRNALKDYAQCLNYSVLTLGNQNLVIGDPKTAKFLLTAHQGNPSAVITLLEILRTMPENQRHKVCFVLFDKKKTATNLYAKQFKKAMDRQFALHLTYVATGDHLRMIPTKLLKADRKKLTSLYKICGYFGTKSLLVHEKGCIFHAPSIQQFPYGISICTLQKNKLWFDVSRTNAKKNTVLDETNVNILRAALTSYICCDN